MIHTDNGVPFSSVAPGGLSRLSMWFVRLGIVPERSRPAGPQDNGRHERMHRTLKQATAQPPKVTARLQQKAFHEFRISRQPTGIPRSPGPSHTPGLLRSQSTLLSGLNVPALEYGDDAEIRRASKPWSVRWRGERTFISEVFAYEPLGLKPLDERWAEIYYGPIRLGWVDAHKHTFSRCKPAALKPERSQLRLLFR